MKPAQQHVRMPKEKKEVLVCMKVAEAVNKIEGTDFAAEKAPSRAPDVVLKSASGQFPNRLMEVVTIPRDLTMREDNQNILNLEDELTECLTKLDVGGCDVHLNIKEEVYNHGIRREAIRDLAEIIAGEPELDRWRVTGLDLWPRSKELSQRIYSVRVYPHKRLRDVTVCVGLGGWIPQDGAWIEEAISAKLRKYGGSQAVKDWILVISASLFVDTEQIADFQAKHPPATLPFREIWLVSPWDGVIALKR